MGWDRSHLTRVALAAVTQGMRLFMVKTSLDIDGARQRRQFIINATPALVLMACVIYLIPSLFLSNPTLVSTILLEIPVPLVGLFWFHAIRSRDRLPTYWHACLICQLTVFAGILGGQGTLINTHYYFLFFFLMAPLIVPLSDRWGMLVVCGECLFWFTFFQFGDWPAAPDIQMLPERTIQFAAYFVLVSCNSLLLIAFIMSDTLMEKLERKILLLATTDALTGLANRRSFHIALERASLRFERTQTPFCLAMLDIDFFKKINDTYGHEVGDEVLRRLASILKASNREGDLVVRLGGEEFAIIMENTALPEATTALERVRTSVECADFVADGQAIHVTVSIGVAQWRGSCDSKRFFETVDRALYTAKNRGRNNVCAEVGSTPSVKQAVEPGETA